MARPSRGQSRRTLRKFFVTNLRSRAKLPAPNTVSSAVPLYLFVILGCGRAGCRAHYTAKVPMKLQQHRLLFKLLACTLILFETGCAVCHVRTTAAPVQ